MAHRRTMGGKQFLANAPIYTPSRFDLDPCAAPIEAPWTCATVQYRLPQDGLALPWRGRVWLNPPFNRQAGIWIARLAQHGQGVALVHARVETVWWQPIWRQASAILFLHQRVIFHKVDGMPALANSGAPVALCSFGRDDRGRLAGAALAGVLVKDWTRP